MSFTKLFGNPILILAAIVWIYVLIPFLAPIAYVNGYESIGRGINEIYEYFCHQRVERSLFLFSNSSTVSIYSVGELKEVGYLPDRVTGKYKNVWPEYFGHDFVGDSDVGYKVPLCIRDLSLYFSLALLLTLLGIIKKKTRVKLLAWKYLYLLAILLVLPMVVDGIAQTVVENLKITSVSMEFINSLSKRVITGSLFGVGVGLIISKLFETNSLTKREEKGTM
jgi:uncharacterized membrane protein